MIGTSHPLLKKAGQWTALKVKHQVLSDEESGEKALFLLDNDSPKLDSIQGTKAAESAWEEDSGATKRTGRTRQRPGMKARKENVAAAESG